MSCPHVLTVEGQDRGLGTSLRSSLPHPVSFLFPGPELPKPEVISQLEQGAELWVVERGLARGSRAGEKWEPLPGAAREWVQVCCLEGAVCRGPGDHLQIP